jgi:SAM-dependent methyltransferase
MTINSLGQDLPRPLFSRFYAKISPGMEAEGMADLRRELLAPLTGEVVEVGAGNGLNFAHYPAGVNRVVAIEPEPRLRALAAMAAEVAHPSVTVPPGRAQHLPLPDHTVDGAVLCLVLCSIPTGRPHSPSCSACFDPAGLFGSSNTPWPTPPPAAGFKGSPMPRSGHC